MSVYDPYQPPFTTTLSESYQGVPSSRTPADTSLAESLAA
jgi:hypothetical protein